MAEVAHACIHAWQLLAAGSSEGLESAAVDWGPAQHEEAWPGPECLGRDRKPREDHCQPPGGWKSL